MKKLYLFISLLGMLSGAAAQTTLPERSRVKAVTTVTAGSAYTNRNSAPDVKEPVGPAVNNGGLTLSIKTVNDDYVTTENDYTIIAKPAGLYSKKEIIKITLPDAVANPGRVYVIKNASGRVAGSNARVEVYLPDSQQVGETGLKYYALLGWQQVTLQSDGAQWWSVGN